MLYRTVGIFSFSKGTSNSILLIVQNVHIPIGILKIFRYRYSIQLYFCRKSTMVPVSCTGIRKKTGKKNAHLQRGKIKKSQLVIKHITGSSVGYRTLPTGTRYRHNSFIGHSPVAFLVSFSAFYRQAQRLDFLCTFFESISCF